MNPVDVIQGIEPIILAMPHTGIFVPENVHSSLNETGHLLADTDWHVDRLYEGLLPGASIIRANFHRYVIDANRAPSGVSLYPGENTTSLCPTTDFTGASIYHEEHQPDDAEIECRRLTFHAPYHAALQAEIERVHAEHGMAVLYDCHSIRSQISFLFDGKLPDLNIGTYGGRSCAKTVEQTVQEVCNHAEDFTSVLNGRFKGGWTTRHYGQPSTGIHAIQMELAQSTYMEETAPWKYRDDKAKLIRPHLKLILEAIRDEALKLTLTSE
ncbi:MAG: N-formylglutamate deformylase [Marinicaulis sp.]|nr:N-formylglutamate deformylase [Marinicaulis sp.]